MIIIQTQKGIKQEVFTTMTNSLLNMQDGDMWTARGGLGNKIVGEIMKQDGKYYERKNSTEEWKEFDVAERTLNVLKRLF